MGVSVRVEQKDLIEPIFYGKYIEKVHFVVMFLWSLLRDETKDSVDVQYVRLSVRIP